MIAGPFVTAQICIMNLMQTYTPIMRALLFKTGDSYAPLLLRILLAVALFPHGAQKVFGWFGGYGFSGTMQLFTTTFGLPWLIALLVIIIEFFGAFALLFGFITRVAGLAIAGVMLGIVLTSHLQNGFFMNWYGTQKGEGIEYFIPVIAIALSLVISGGGKWSIDRCLGR